MQSLIKCNNGMTGAQLSSRGTQCKFFFCFFFLLSFIKKISCLDCFCFHFLLTFDFFFLFLYFSLQAIFFISPMFLSLGKIYLDSNQFQFKYAYLPYSFNLEWCITSTSKQNSKTNLNDRCTMDNNNNNLTYIHNLKKKKIMIIL